MREAEAQLLLGDEVPTSRLRQLVERDASRPCLEDPEAWFPVHETVELAQRLCGGCPVRELCLELALRQPEAGIWGATTTKEREQQIRRRRRRSVAAVSASDGTAA